MQFVLLLLLEDLSFQLSSFPLLQLYPLGDYLVLSHDLFYLCRSGVVCALFRATFLLIAFLLHHLEDMLDELLVLVMP